MNRIIINTIDCSLIIKTTTIIYCKAEGSYTRLVLNNSKDILVTKNLSWFENILSSSTFIRIHRSFLVNLEYVTQISHGKNTVGLTNGKNIPFSRYNLKQLIEVLDKVVPA